MKVHSIPSSFPLFGDVVGYECESVIIRKAFKVSQYIHNILETPKSDADSNAPILYEIHNTILCAKKTLDSLLSKQTESSTFT